MHSRSASDPWIHPKNEPLSFEPTSLKGGISLAQAKAFKANSFKARSAKGQSQHVSTLIYNDPKETGPWRTNSASTLTRTQLPASLGGASFGQPFSATSPALWASLMARQEPQPVSRFRHFYRNGCEVSMTLSESRVDTGTDPKVYTMWVCPSRGQPAQAWRDRTMDPPFAQRICSTGDLCSNGPDVWRPHSAP